MSIHFNMLVFLKEIYLKILKESFKILNNTIDNKLFLKEIKKYQKICLKEYEEYLDK